jgi:hypothetical protein
MSAAESAQLYKRMDRMVERSPAWRAWVLDHRQYLSAVDAVTAKTIESLLDREHKGRLQQGTKPESDMDVPHVAD